MHDLDRTTLESNFGYETSETGPLESEALSEQEITELSGELLTLGGEHELDHFLDGLIGTVGKALGSVLPKSITKPLGGLLKGVAGKVLPMAGAALGNMVVPGLGGAIGGQLASGLGSALGLELEGLSNEEQEFHLARRFVQLAADAARHAAQAGGGVDPRAIAWQALQAAAQRYAPGLLAMLNRMGAPAPGPSGGGAPPPQGETLSEADEMELASELMEATNEYEVDRFLGDLVQSAGRLLGQVTNSQAGRAITGYLKQAAAHALPQVAQAIGTKLGGAAGGDMASQLAAQLGSSLGLSGEMSGEDEQYEAARRFVRWGSDAARRALGSSYYGDPLSAARQAMQAAAQNYWSGYGGGYQGGGYDGASQTGQDSGRWVRRGNKIILFGV